MKIEMESCQEHEGALVVFGAGEECPLCTAQEKIDEQQDEIELLKEEIKDLEAAGEPV